MTARALVVAALFAAAACASSTPTATTTSIAPTTSPRVTTTIAPGATTTATTTTTTTVAAPLAEDLLVIGDSVAGQLFHALHQRSETRSGPRVTYLLSAGPQFADDWPEPLPRFVDDAATTAIIVSFGVWQAAPPEGSTPSGGDDITADIEAYLKPIADLSAPVAQLYLLADIDDPAANQHIQAVNRAITEAAGRVGLPTTTLLPGQIDGRPNTVTVAETELPVRNGADATHFCAAAVLVMADQLLDELGVEPAAPTLVDLDQLLAATADTNYFTDEGCGFERGSTAPATG